MPQSPVRYSPSIEMREVDEFETNLKLVETLRSISEITYKDSDTRCVAFMPRATDCSTPNLK
jgi:hypothetical protein